MRNRQMRKITNPMISVVSTMVEVTAKPNAAAKAVDDRNPSTRPITATQSSALTAGAKICPRSAAEVWTDHEPRQIAELDRLRRDGEGAGDRGLACDHGRHSGEGEHRPERPAGRQQEECLLHGSGVVEHQRGLAGVAEQQGR